MRAVRQDSDFEDWADVDMEEGALVAAARHSHAAFAPLYRKYATPIYRYFYQGVDNIHDAEDLTATTFSKALAGLASYESRGSFAAWLFGIARHTLMDHKRVRYSTGIEIDLEAAAPILVDPGPEPEKYVLLREQTLQLRQLITNLPTEQREALVLRIFGELRTKDIAIVMSKSDGAVKMLIQRAVETLRILYTSLESQGAQHE